MECDDNLICIDSEYFDKDKPNYFIKKYSQPYNNPKLKFVIFCDTKETENYILFILKCELEQYLTGPFDWYKNFDIKCIKNILEKEELDNYDILMEGDDMLLKFEENEYRKHKEYNDRLKEDLFWKKADNMTFEDIIKKYGRNPNNIEKYEKFYKDWLEFNKTILYTSQEELAKGVKLGLYKIIKKDNEK
jgi:hypothetical protein